MTSPASPYLSVVVVSRNDDHGGDPLTRTQVFLNCLARQCERHGLQAELIVVDWNPPGDRVPMSLALRPPPSLRSLHVRFVTVPPALHARFKYADRLPLFQMIGKNVGIRRARAPFVLATNIDLLFSDELFAFVGRRELDARTHYRVDRIDIQPGLTADADPDTALAYAWSNVVRINRRLAPKLLVRSLYGDGDVPREVRPPAALARRYRQLCIGETGGVASLAPAPRASLDTLHTNACGDFALMSREGWEAIRGYPEFEAFSMNIDSVGLAASHYAGYHECTLLPPAACFHIEHGEGFSVAAEARMYAWLKAVALPSPSWQVLRPVIDAMQARQQAIVFNHADWGLQHHELAEAAFGEVPRSSDPDPGLRAGAARPGLDYDDLAADHARGDGVPAHYFDRE